MLCYSTPCTYRPIRAWHLWPRPLCIQVFSIDGKSCAETPKAITFSSTIQEYDFEVGSLVLCAIPASKRSSTTKQASFSGSHGGWPSYQGWCLYLTELKQAISRLRYAAFQIIPYLARFPDHIPVTSLLDDVELEDVSFVRKAFRLQMNLPDDTLLMIISPTNPSFFSSSLSIDIPLIRQPPPTLIG